MKNLPTNDTPTVNSALFNSVLAQDFVTSDNILVDAQIPGQVAIFRNPYQSSSIGALVISNTDMGENQLQYLYQDATSITGWTLDPMLDPSGNSITATQVIAFANTWGGVEAFYIDTNGTLQHLWLANNPAAPWNFAPAVSGAPNGLGLLRVAYSPGASSENGTVALYAGDTDGHSIYIYWSTDGNWNSNSLYLGGAAASWTMSLSGETSWLLTIVAKYNFTYRPNNGQPIGTLKEGNMAWAAGNLGSSGITVTGAGYNHSDTFVSVAINATNMAGTSQTMVLALDDATDAEGGHAVKWVVNPQSSSSPASGNIVGTSFSAISTIESSDGFVNVFGIDPMMNLYTLRQVAFNEGDMVPGYGTDQTWGPVFQLDSRIARLYPDISMADSPTLMAVDADAGALHLYVMDPTTKLWMEKPIQLPTATKYEITTWQTDVTVYDDQGSPLPLANVAITAQSATDVLINDSYHIVDSKTAANVQSNGLGKLTITSLATTLSPPAFSMSAAGLAQQASHSPGNAINDYFAGTREIMGKPGFSPDVVKQFNSNSPISSNDAYTAIAQCATLAQSSTGNAAAKSKLDLMISKGRYHVYSRTATPSGNHTSYLLRVDAHSALVTAEGISDVWDDVWNTAESFAGDVWHAIEKGLHAVESFVIDLENKTVALVIRVGDALVKLAEWLIDTVEAGLKAITAVINWIEAKVEEVIDWLKALFDFQAIWNTKEVLATQLKALPDYLIGQFDTWSNQAEGFFASKKAEIDSYFDQYISAHQGKNFSQVQGWLPIGAPPGNEPVAENVHYSTLTTDPQVNWMQNKVSSRGPSSFPDQPESADSAIENFFEGLADIGADVEKIFQDMLEAIWKLFDPSNPSSFQDIAISAFLTIVKDTVDLLIDIADTLVQGLLALGEVAMLGFKAIINQNLNIGFIRDLYEWIAGKNGADTSFTVADLISLVAAVPITIVYKLIAGVDKEPFPNAEPLNISTTPSNEVKQVFGTVLGVLTVIGGVWTAWGDIQDPAPAFVGWLSKGTTGLKQVFSHPGFLEWGPLEWGTTAAVAANLLWLAPTAYFINSSYNIADKVKTGVEGKLPTAWVFDDLSKLGTSVIGVITLGVTIFDAAVGDNPALYNTAKLIEGTVAPFSFLTMTPIKELNIEGIPVGRIVQGLKVALDVSANTGGGALEIANAWVSPDALTKQTIDGALEWA